MMIAEDLSCLFVQCRQPERKTRTTMGMFVIPYNVVQELISSFYRNDNTLILITPAVNRGIPNFGIPFPLDNMYMISNNANLYPYLIVENR